MLAKLIQEVFATFRDPRAFARDVVLVRDHSLRTSFNIATLAVVLNMLQISAVLFGAGPDALESRLELPEGTGAPDGGEAVISFSFYDLVLIAGAAAAAQIGLVSIGGAVIGRLFGGSGAFQQVMAVVSWHALCLVIAGIVVSIAEVLLGPSLGGMLAIAVFIFGFWMLASLIGEVHGFERTGVVAVGILASLAVFALVLGLFLGVFHAMFGVG